MPPSAAEATLWSLFSLSFFVALTGALSPGPLFTYTILRSARARRRGYLMGVWIILGHALLELGIVVGLLAGFSVLLENAMMLRTIGLTGGLILVAFGVVTLRDLLKKKIGIEFSPSPGGVNGSNPTWDNPVLGGVLVSMSNPYWWIWWASIGGAFMVRFDVTLESWPRLLAFFAGHETGDLLWYIIVSTFAYFGIKRLHPSFFKTILAICGLFMIGFGLYLGISIFRSPLP